MIAAEPFEAIPSSSLGGPERKAPGVRILTICCKAPRVGEVKTRLSPLLSPVEAASLARAFLRDLSASLADLPGCELRVAIPDDAAEEDFAGIFDRPLRFVPQGEGGLGERLARVTGAALTQGEGPVAVIGSDHPNLPLEFVSEMFEKSKEGQVAWVPTDDGGFAALALAQATPSLFAGVPWSTGDVADAVRRNAAAAGIEMVDLGPWYDVDTVEDLARLERDLRGSERCPATRAVLDGLRPPLAEREGGSGS